MSSLGPGASRTLGELDQGVVSPQTGRQTPSARPCARGRCGCRGVGGAELEHDRGLCVEQLMGSGRRKALGIQGDDLGPLTGHGLK